MKQMIGKDRHHRKSIRLPGCDYSRPGAYFVTLCTQDRTHLFGRILDGVMQLNEWGEIALRCWQAIPHHFSNIALDEFVIMPNHMHGILWIVNDVGARHAVPLESIRNYIINNPLQWHLDRENPHRTGHDGLWDRLFGNSVGKGDAHPETTDMNREATHD